MGIIFEIIWVGACVILALLYSTVILYACTSRCQKCHKIVNNNKIKWEYAGYKNRYNIFGEIIGSIRYYDGKCPKCGKTSWYKTEEGGLIYVSTYTN